MNEYFRTFYSISIIIIMKISRKYPVNPLYPALKRLPFPGFQSSLIADRRGSAIRPAIETLQKANRSCGRTRMATSTVDHWFSEYLQFRLLYYIYYSHLPNRLASCNIADPLDLFPWTAQWLCFESSDFVAAICIERQKNNAKSCTHRTSECR